MTVSPCVPLASGMEPMYWSSFMTSSMQLAKECLSQRLTDDLGESFQPLEGLEKFAETIETGAVQNYCTISQHLSGPFSQGSVGLIMISTFISVVLRRVKVTFLDTVLRIEHVPENSKTGIALEMRINK